MTVGTTRRTTFASGDLTLEGVLHLPEVTRGPGAAVCHPHPQYGGDMDNNVVLAVCDALVSRGIVTLRFNFRGTGASDGAYDDGDGEREDVRNALRYVSSLEETGGGLVLAGYSFGAMMAAEVAAPELKALALISPAVAFGDLRVGWGCPTLIIAGDNDPIAPGDRLAVLAEQAGAEVFVVPGADHSWWGFEDELGEAVGQFFSNHLRAR